MSLVELQVLPLPREPPTYEEWQKHSPQYLSAYNLAFNAEGYATKDDDIISARVAGYFLIELFKWREILSTVPCDRLLIQLQSESRKGGSVNDVVFQVGKMYRERFIRLFKTTTTTYPTPSLHPSRPSFDTLEEALRATMKVDNTDYRTTKKKALCRDGHRCLLTGSFNEISRKEIREVRNMCISLGGSECMVAACHILNESTMQGVDPTGSSGERVEAKTSYASGAMTILSYFGLEGLVHSFLARNGVHRLGNLLSLDPICHRNFDNLNLWFEPTDVQNRYRVCVPTPSYGVHIRLYRHLESEKDNLYVTFSSPDNELELPDCRLLMLHAACARVAHMSGAAEAFDKVERDLEDTLVLAVDGSSAHLLDHLLTPLGATPAVA